MSLFITQMGKEINYMKKPRFKNWRLFATLALLGQTIGGAIGPTGLLLLMRLLIRKQ